MKINLLIIFLFISFFSNAQITKGALFIGGDLSLNAAKYKASDGSQLAYKNQSYNFSPSLGWVVKDNFIVGGRLSASYFSYDQQPVSPSTTKGNSFGAGIWMRKYLPLGKSFFVFADAGLGGYSNYRKQTNNQQPFFYYKENGYTISASVYPGLSYRVRKSLFLEAALNNLISLGYGRTNSEQKNPDGSLSKGYNNIYNLSSSISNGVPLQIGIRWIIAKK